MFLEWSDLQILQVSDPEKQDVSVTFGTATFHMPWMLLVTPGEARSTCADLAEPHKDTAIQI